MLGQSASSSTRWGPARTGGRASPRSSPPVIVSGGRSAWSRPEHRARREPHSSPRVAPSRRGQADMVGLRVSHEGDATGSLERPDENLGREAGTIERLIDTHPKFSTSPRASRIFTSRSRHDRTPAVKVLSATAVSLTFISVPNSALIPGSSLERVASRPGRVESMTRRRGAAGRRRGPLQVDEDLQFPHPTHGGQLEASHLAGGLRGRGRRRPAAFATSPPHFGPSGLRLLDRLLPEHEVGRAPPELADELQVFEDGDLLPFSSSSRSSVKSGPNEFSCGDPGVLPDARR